MTKLKSLVNKETILKYHLEIGIMLCFLLPPIGILWLVVIGWRHLNKIIYNRVPLHFNTTTFFFICLLLSSAGASITQHTGKYLLIFALIAGYLGLYLYIKENTTFASINRYKYLMIAGGFYLFVSGFLFRGFYGSNVLIGYLTGTQFIGGPPGDDEPRLFGSAYNPNFTAFLLLLTFTFLLSTIMENMKNGLKQKQKYYIPLLLVNMIGIFETGSRSGVAAMFILALFFVIKSYPKIGLTSIAALYLIKDQILMLIPRNDAISQSTFMRKEIWENSIRIWKDHPFFGTTPLGFSDAYAHFDRAVPHAHNIVLAFFAEYGTIGGLAFLLLAISVMYKFCCLYFLSSKRKKLLNFFLLSLPVILLTGIFDHPLVSPQTALLTIILLASWDKYTATVPFVEKSVQHAKRALLWISYWSGKPQHMSKSHKNKTKL